MFLQALKSKWLLIVYPLTITMIILSVVVDTAYAWVGFAICAVSFFILDQSQLLCLLMGLMPFGNIFKYSTDAISFLTILEILTLVYLLLKTSDVSRKFIFVFAGLAVYLVLQLILGNTVQLVDITKTLVRIALIYFFGRGLSLQQIRNFVFFLSLSMCVSLLFCWNEDFFEAVLPYFEDNSMRVEGLLQYELVYRNSGLFNDPNYCSVAIITNLAMLMVLYYYKAITWEFWVFALILIPIGITTYSKSYILMLIVLLALFYVFVLIPRHKIISILFAIAMVAFIYFALLGEFETLNLLLARFEMRGDQTSGRFALNKYYLDYLNSNTKTLLFGDGLSADRLAWAGNNVHNAFIDFVFKIGVFGTALYGGCIGLSVPRMGGKKKFVNFLPLICIITMYMFLAAINMYDLWYYILICIGAVKMAEWPREAAGAGEELDVIDEKV